MENYVLDYMKDTVEMQKAMLDEDFRKNLVKISKLIVDCYEKGGKLLLAGNGGSAGDAQHIAGELLNKFFIDRKGLPCVTLTTDTSTITAVGNDYDFERVFTKQIEANAKAGDIFIGLSTSGNSKNIVNAMKYCKENGIINVGFVGSKECQMDKLCDEIIKIPSTITPHIQEGHIVCYHLICALVEEMIFGEKFKR